MFRGHVELAGKLFDQVIMASAVGLLTSSCTKVGKGAVDTADDDGWTPLIIAASAGHNQLVEMLLANGANVNATTSQVGKRPCATLKYNGPVSGPVCPSVLCKQGQG